MESNSASNERLTVANINAPVNSEKALSKIYPMLKRIAYPMSAIDGIICIGTWRLVFSVEYAADGPIVRYEPHKEVIDNPRGPEYARNYMFVTSPITMPHPFAMPYQISVNMDDRIINSILKPLRDDQKLDFLYGMSRVLIDPISDPSVIVLYGPSGHEGKTTLAKFITRILGSSVMWVSEDIIGSKSKWPTPDQVMTMCERRILICDKCDIEGGFNYQSVKKWTSNAPVTVGIRTGILAQTCIVVSNKIPFYEKAAVNNSIGRRLVIYDMRKNLGSERPISGSEVTSSVILKFISLCLACGDAYSSTPTSLPIAMYAMFRKSINQITAGIGYDVGSTREESMIATVMMAIRCHVKPEILCQAMASISKSLVIKPTCGIPYVKDLKPTMKMRLTSHGEEIVLTNRGKMVYDLDMLKDVVKLL